MLDRNCLRHITFMVAVACCVAVVTASLQARAAVDRSLKVLAWSTTAVPARSIELNSGDPVEPRAELRISVDGSDLTRLQVLARPTSGQAVGTATLFQAEAGNDQLAPFDDVVFKAPDEEGGWLISLHALMRDGRREIMTFKIIVAGVSVGDQSSLAARLEGASVDLAQATLPAFVSKLNSSSLQVARNYASTLLVGPKLDEPALVRGGAVTLYATSASRVVKILSRGASGTGSIISEDGGILTNWHVVRGSTTVGVLFKPNNLAGVSSDHVYAADVVVIDEVADLALLKLKDPLPGLTAIQLFDKATPEIGENVHAIGHPQGQDWTYTRGYISQVRGDFEWPADETSTHKATVIQTQTPINPGNSGGPLLNDDGLMVGVNSFIRTDSQGINYAVSVGDVRRFISERQDRKLARLTYPAAYTINRKSIIKVMDNNGNGVIDTTLMDINGNGVGDLIAVDTNEDGVPEYMIIDQNENGRPDGEIRPTREEGKMVWVWGIDADENGEVEAICIDNDGDFQVDRCRKN